MLRMFVLGVLMMPIVSCDKDTDGDGGDDVKQEGMEEVEETEDFFVDAVDLGLSVKWAEHNIGAIKPEEYGSYYAWGEVEGKSNYDSDTYIWFGVNGDIAKYYYDDNNTCCNIILELEDDVAHMEWGGNWRMPTIDELMELCEKCDWQWTIINGVKGQKVTGPNGNSIFLPAAGNYGDGEYNSGGGYYWSSTLDVGNACGAHYLDFDEDCWGCYGYGDRYYGLSVRPVKDDLPSVVAPLG